MIKKIYDLILYNIFKKDKNLIFDLLISIFKIAFNQN